MNKSLPLLEVQLERIENVYLPDSWHDKNYQDGFTRLYYIMGGEGTINHSGKIYNLSPGYIYLIPEYTRHDYRHGGNLQMFYLHCQIRTPGGISFFDLYNCEYVINCKEKGVGWKEFNHLKKLSGQGDTASLLTVSSLLLQLISLFAGSPRISTRMDGDRYEKDLARFMGVLNYIERHHSEDPSVTELASLVNMERSVFTRSFSRVMGLAPGQFVQKKRIEAARKLLDSTELSCEQVGEKLGFYDASHFSRIFYRETGIRPGEYRERELPLNPSGRLTSHFLKNP